MRPSKRFGLAVLGLFAAAVAGSRTVAPRTVVEHEAALSPEPLATAAIAPSAGQRGFEGALAALDEPMAIDMPFVEEGSDADAVAEAFSFTAARGQTLEVALEARSAARVYVEVYRVIDVLGQSLRERLTALKPTATVLRTRIPSDGRYSVLVEPEVGSETQYRLTLELSAALPFPVLGADVSAVRSVFGASRDAGKRHHQGVDIFAARLTPVIAVAAGTATPRHDKLGGNTVWLDTPGTSYYYAHLDRVSVREPQRVRAGDILGYIGNTGNARRTPSHLHFGVYRLGTKPVDPLPLLTPRLLPKHERRARPAVREIAENESPPQRGTLAGAMNRS